MGSSRRKKKGDGWGRFTKWLFAKRSSLVMPISIMTCQGSTALLSPEMGFGSEEKGVQNSWCNPVCTTQCLLKERDLLMIEMEQESQMSLFVHALLFFTVP